VRPPPLSAGDVSYTGRCPSVSTAPTLPRASRCVPAVPRPLSEVAPVNRGGGTTGEHTPLVEPMAASSESPLRPRWHTPPHTLGFGVAPSKIRTARKMPSGFFYYPPRVPSASGSRLLCIAVYNFTFEEEFDGFHEHYSLLPHSTIATPIPP